MQRQKCFLITGGSRGLGRSMALHLAKRGVGGVITYRSRRDEAEQVVAKMRALGVHAEALQLDAAEPGCWRAFGQQFRQTLSEKFGRDTFDYLVNNAGMGAHGLIAETQEEQFDQLMQVHFKSVFFLTQDLMPILADGGRILNISSGLTRFTFPGYAAYASMKGAIEVLTHYLAKELGGRGIAVNTVAPGAIETDFGGGAVRDNQDLNKMIAAQTALGRVGLPDDVGAMVASLLSDKNAWITAQRIEVSGGMLI